MCNDNCDVTGMTVFTNPVDDGTCFQKPFKFSRPVGLALESIFVANLVICVYLPSFYKSMCLHFLNPSISCPSFVRN